MSAYQPPREDLVIFDNSVFTDTNPSGNLTRQQADALYVHYPFAQGSETFPSISVTGTSLFSNTVTANNNINLGGEALVNYLQFPDSTKQYTAAIDYLNTNNNWYGKNQFYGDVSFNAFTTIDGAKFSITNVPSTSDAANIAVYDLASNSIKYEPSGNIINATKSNLLASNNAWTGKNQFNADVSLNSITSLTSDVYATALTSNGDTNCVSFNTSTKKLGYAAIPPAPSTLLASNNTWTGKNQFNADVSLNSTKTILSTTHLLCLPFIPVY